MAYLDDLPQLLQPVAEYRALGKALDPLMTHLTGEISQFPVAVLPREARGALLARWEEMVGLTPAGTEAQRQFRLISRLTGLRPYTAEQLRRQLAAAFGREDGFSVEIDAAAFSVTVEVDEGGADVLSGLTAELREMIPANMSLYTGVSQAEVLSLYAGAVLQVSQRLMLTT